MDSRPVCLGVRHSFQTRDQFFLFLELFLDSYLMLWGRLLWREVGSVVLSWAYVIDSIFETSNLEGHVPVFISPRNRVAQLYPQALGLSIKFTYYCI
jgi:hypothetical protein